MQNLKKLLKITLFLIEFVFILLYIFLEEIVWDNFAEPIFKYIKYLRIFERLEIILKRSNKYVVLTVFLMPFVIGELIGLATPILVVKEYFLLAALAYALKLLIVAFAFWVFNTQKKRLLSFKWLDFLYKKTIYIINKIKETKVYKSAKIGAKKAKIFIKEKFRSIKNKILYYLNI
jgi:hypothetical protein